MSEGVPKPRHIWPPNSGKEVHAREVLGLPPNKAQDVEEIDLAERKMLKKFHPDVKGGSHEHASTITAAAREARARAQGRFNEKTGEIIPEVTLQSLRSEELTAQAHIDHERRQQNPNALEIGRQQEKLRAIAAKRAQLEREAARASAADEREQEERREAGKREREAAEAAKERERLERVEAAREREEEEAAAFKQPEPTDKVPGEELVETENTQPEEEPVATGFDVVPYVERDAEVVPQGEVIDHPIEPPGTEVVTVRESSSEEAPAEEEPGRAVVVAESSSSGDIVPASAEAPVQGGEVVPYEEEEYFPLAAAGGGGGGEGGGGDDEDAAHDHPEGHDPHHAHAHDAHHGDHGHGDHGHGHDSHDSGHGAGGHGSHAHGEKKKGLFGAWMSFFGSLFKFPEKLITGIPAFFGKGGGGGGGAESHGH